MKERVDVVSGETKGRSIEQSPSRRLKLIQSAVLLKVVVVVATNELPGQECDKEHVFACKMRVRAKRDPRVVDCM